MTKTQLATVCALWIHGTIACGSSTNDALGGDGTEDSGSGGAVASSGGAGGRAGSGGRTGTGGATAAGGRNNGGSAGSIGTGGNVGAGGGAGDGGSVGTGGVAGDGGPVGSGGTTSDGGPPGSGGALGAGGTLGAGGLTSDGGPVGSGGTGDGGPVGSGGTISEGGPSVDGGVICDPVHPNVNGSSRTCNPGFCYCSGNDGCFPDAVASSCCVQGVVCGAGAVDPIATINHPGDGETRAANVDIPFIGVAVDPQDGALSGAALVWTSSALAAPIGTGPNFQAALPAGTHVITLTVTDSDSNTGSDTITLIIQ